MNPIATEGAAELQPVRTQPATPLELIELALERGLDPGKLMDLAERWQANRAAEEFAKAIAGFQAECPQILKERVVNRKDGGRMYLFASYDDIKKRTQPLQTKWKIATTFTAPKVENNVMTGTCRVRVGSHFEDTTLSLPVPKGLNTNSAQDFGQAVSYLKRYLYCMALDIVVTDEDDDAQALGDCITAKQIEEVNRAIADCEAAGKPINFQKFLAWLGVSSLDQLPQRDVDKAVAELRRKAKEGAK